MEVITIPGYTEDEKLHIARMHLVPRQSDAHRLTTHDWAISDAALLRIIRVYTREPGVRNLTREIAILARKTVRAISFGKSIPVEIDTLELPEFLGLERYRYGEAETEDLMGVAAGLAWTEIGGDLLSVEAVTMPGNGRLVVAGKWAVSCVNPQRLQ
jgi:ATP-dependent Lon protease